MFTILFEQLAYFKVKSDFFPLCNFWSFNVLSYMFLSENCLCYIFLYCVVVVNFIWINV